MQIFSAKDIFCAIILLVFEFAWQTNGKFGTEFAIRLLRQVKSESARRNEFAYFTKGHTMKRLLLIITLVLFSAGFISEAFAAPARGGGAATKRTAKKATTAKKRVATKKVAKPRIQRAPAEEAVSKLTEFQQDFQASEAKKRGKEQQFGLMPSDIDNTNHNVFHADAVAIKGAKDTESALRYLPFVTIVNTAGFGSSFDLRGQGRLSANGVRLFLNGVPATPTDSYFNPMPIHTVMPHLIQEVSVQPGGGAVLFGSGAKGGTINIITSQRGAPVFIVGGGYTNIAASKGNSFNAYAQANENLGRRLKVNAGLAGAVLGGPRTDDLLTSAQAVLGAWYDIGWGQSVSVDADAFYAKNKTTPYNSLLDFENINTFMLSEVSLPMVSLQGSTARYPFEENRYLCLAGQASCSYPITDFSPSKEDRATKGYGSIDTTLLRATARVDYTSSLTERLKLGATTFGNFQSTKFNEHKMNLPFFVLGVMNPHPENNQNSIMHYNRGYNWFLPRPANINHPSGTSPLFVGANGDNERADWHLLDQSGSKYDDYKIGGKARVDWQHNNGLFIIGADFYYEMSKRDSKSYLRQAIIDGSAMAGLPGYNNTLGGDLSLKYSSTQFTSLQAKIFDKSDINVLTTAVYLYERYDFNRNLSLGLGARYELKNYDVKITDNFEGKKLAFKDTNHQAPQYCVGTGNCDFVDYDNSNYTEGELKGTGLGANQILRPAVINGVLQTTDKAGNKNPNGIATSEAKGEYSKNHDNFIFELAPVYRYSNTGAIYARGELGYKAPPAWAMLRRIGIVWGASSPRDTWIAMTQNFTTGQQGNGGNPLTQNTTVVAGATPYGNTLEFDFDFEDTQLKNETYYTAELGWKELIGTRQIPLGFTNLTINALMFNANVFYTASQDEFYFEGDTWSGMKFGNYEKSRRYGVELAAEQYLFGGALGFNESFTYLKAQKFDCGELNPLTQTCATGNEWQAIPYTYDWKATLGAAVNISTFLEVIDVDISVWLQNSIYGKQNIYAQRMNVQTFPVAGGIANPNITQTATQTQAPIFYATKEDAKLDPYLVSDFGISVGFNKNAGVITVGVKNVFDTFYYDYYNNDRSAVVNENRYVIGRGRTVFLEGTFKY